MKVLSGVVQSYAAWSSCISSIATGVTMALSRRSLKEGSCRRTGTNRANRVETSLYTGAQVLAVKK